MSATLTLRTQLGDEELDLGEFEARVRRGEISPQTMVRIQAVTGERFVPACELELFRRQHRPRRSSFMRRFAFDHFPWITAAFILLQLGVYFVTARNGPLDLDGLVRSGGKVAPLIFDLGQLWRLLSANLLHGDGLHVGLNIFVLLNVGTALENAYRPLDYLFLLISTALGSMLASLFFAEAATLGSSGIVYGCLAATVYFGLRYRAILPESYRKLLGEAAVPTVVVFLWIGWSSVGVDTAAHLGGLLTGFLVAPWLTPRLLVEDPSAQRSFLLRVLPTLGLLVSVALGSAYLADALPNFDVKRQALLGWQLPIPRGWRAAELRPGEWSFDNGLPGAGKALVYVRLEPGTPTPAEAARAWSEDELRPDVLGPDVLSVDVGRAAAARLGAFDALRVQGTIATTSTSLTVEAYFIPRGELLYRFVFIHDRAFPEYATLAERIGSGVQLVEPRFLETARARALLVPGANRARAELGLALERVGEPSASASALREAVRQEPSRVEWRLQLARVLLESGNLGEACREAEAVVLYSPDRAEPRELMARCELGRGNPLAALARLREARERAPRDRRLEAAEERLREALGTELP